MAKAVDLILSNKEKVELFLNAVDSFDAPKVRMLIEEIKRHRKEVFGNTIEQVNFYLYGQLNEKAPVSLYDVYADDYGNYYHPHYKVDTTPEAISSKATGQFLGVLLPKSFYSFSVEYDKRKTETPVSQEKQLIESGNEATEILREYLSKEVKNFTTTLAQVVKDYLEYGSCALYYDRVKKRITHLPFRNSYFYSRVGDDNFFYMYEDELLYKDYIMNDYVRVKPAYNPQKKYVIQYLYVPIKFLRNVCDETAAGGDEYDDRYALFVFDKETSTILNAPCVEVFSYSDLPIYAARNNDRNNNASQYYGQGAAIQALSSIKGCNIALRNLYEGAAQSIYPSILLPSGVNLNKSKRSNKLIIYPGSVNVLESETSFGAPVSAQQMQMLSTPGAQMEVSERVLAMCISQIEQAFNTETYTLASDSDSMSATEVMERKQEAVTAFRGSATPFYQQLLAPLIEDIFMQACMYVNERNLMNKPHSVKIYTFAEQQNEQVDMMKMEKYMQIKAMSEQVQLNEEEQKWFASSIKPLLVK